MNPAILAFLAVTLGIAFGLWLRKAASDEIKQGKIWFKLLIAVGLAGLIVFAFLGEYASAASCLALAIVAKISL